MSCADSDVDPAEGIASRHAHAFGRHASFQEWHLSLKQRRQQWGSRMFIDDLLGELHPKSKVMSPQSI